MDASDKNVKRDDAPRPHTSTFFSAGQKKYFPANTAIQALVVTVNLHILVELYITYYSVLIVELQCPNENPRGLLAQN